MLHTLLFLSSSSLPVAESVCYIVSTSALRRVCGGSKSNP